MKIPFLDLTRQYRSIRREIDAAIQGVLDRGQFVLGDRVADFERALAAYCRVGHAVGVASGTDALELSLRVAGIGAGDEVIVPALTFIATAEAVLSVGATPAFVDVEPATLTLDVQAIASAASPRTRAIIPVHLFGHPCDMDPILGLARQRGWCVIEDAAQALGAAWRGRPVGSLGDLGCLSFFPTKNLGGYGDGGAITTAREDVDARLRRMRTHGSTDKRWYEAYGRNSRLDELQAAVLAVKLAHLGAWTARRRELAAAYGARLAAEREQGLVLPVERSEATHVYHLYVVRVPQRTKILDALRSQGIGAAAYYEVPLHLQPVFAQLGYQRGALPATEAASQDILALPLFPELTDAELDQVCVVLVDALRTLRQRGTKVGA